MGDRLLGVHSAYLDTHLRYMSSVRNVESPAEYLSNYLGFTKAVGAYESYPLDLVYRVPTLTPADVMLVLKNPNITELSVSKGEGTSEDALIAEYISEEDPRPRNIEKMRQITAVWMANWFTNHPGPQVRLKKLVEAGIEGGYVSERWSGREKECLKPSPGKDEVNSVEDIPEDKSSPEISTFFKYFYVTELSKLRAPTSKWPFHLEEQVLAKQYLRKEIEIVDPKLIIATGGKPQSVTKELAVERLDEELYRLEGSDGSDRYLLVLDHPSFPSADYSRAVEVFQQIPFSGIV